MSLVGTNRTNRAGLTTSVDRGIARVARMSKAISGEKGSLGWPKRRPLLKDDPATLANLPGRSPMRVRGALYRARCAAEPITLCARSFRMRVSILSFKRLMFARLRNDPRGKWNRITAISSRSRLGVDSFATISSICSRGIEFNSSADGSAGFGFCNLEVGRSNNIRTSLFENRCKCRSKAWNAC